MMIHTSCILYCSVPENIHTHPMDGQIMEIPRGRRVSKAGWGDLNQKTLCGGHGYFLEQHISYKVTWY